MPPVTRSSIGTGHNGARYPLPVELPPNLVPKSSLSYNRAQAWLSNCSEDHSLCRLLPEEIGMMPKRKLELRGSQIEPLIRLVAEPRVLLMLH